jgi:hypothetical protein
LDGNPGIATLRLPPWDCSPRTSLKSLQPPTAKVRSLWNRIFGVSSLFRSLLGHGMHCTGDTKRLGYELALVGD